MTKPNKYPNLHLLDKKPREMILLMIKKVVIKIPLLNLILLQSQKNQRYQKEFLKFNNLLLFLEIMFLQLR